MGQQQLLLIILGVIVVGIAVAVGITMFSDNAMNANRDALTNDLVNLASRAQQFYRRPVSLGGGGNDFTKLTSITQLTNNPTNENGTYTLVSASGAGSSAKCVIKGVGTEFYDGVLVSAQVDVFPASDSVYTLN
jgi:Tfp pilus assembly protein PilE